MPRTNRPGRFTGGGGRSGGGLLRRIYGSKGDYEVDENFEDDSTGPKYKDTRSFLAKWYGAPDYAGVLESNRLSGIDSTNQQLRLQGELLKLKQQQDASDRIRQDTDFGTAADAVLRNNPDLQDPNLPLVLAPESRGNILRNMYGKDPLISSIPTGERQSAEALLGRDQAIAGRSSFNQNKGLLAQAASDKARAEQLDASRMLRPDVQAAKDKVATGGILKQLDRSVSPGEALFTGEGDVYQGLTYNEKETPGPVMFTDPKTGTTIRGDPTKTRIPIPAQRLPRVNIKDVQQPPVAQTPQESNPLGNATPITPAPLLTRPENLVLPPTIGAPSMIGGKLQAPITPQRNIAAEQLKQKQEAEKAWKELEKYLGPISTIPNTNR